MLLVSDRDKYIAMSCVRKTRINSGSIWLLSSSVDIKHTCSINIRRCPLLGTVDIEQSIKFRSWILQHRADVIQHISITFLLGVALPAKDKNIDHRVQRPEKINGKQKQCIGLFLNYEWAGKKSGALLIWSISKYTRIQPKVVKNKGDIYDWWVFFWAELVTGRVGETWGQTQSGNKSSSCISC